MNKDELELENVKIVNEHGHIALKSIFLLNGGASIAILTFLGSIAISSSTGKIQPSAVAGILMWFSSGAGLCVLAQSLSYMTLFFWYFWKCEKLSKLTRYLTIGVALGALVCFFVGILEAKHVNRPGFAGDPNS